MKVLIAGAGSVGIAIAEDLSGKGYDIVVMEQDQAVVDKHSLIGGYSIVLGDACEVASLQDAGVGQVEVVVAATGDDEDNLVISLLSKQEFAVPRVVARVNNSKNSWLFNESWGVDVSVSTPQQLTALVEEAVSVGSLVRLFEFEKSDASVLEITLDEGSPALGRALGDLDLPFDVAVVAIVRESNLNRPSPEIVLRAGDEVLLLSTPASEEAVQRALGAS
jgi:trk system potassium uptake protein TrkA